MRLGKDTCRGGRITDPRGSMAVETALLVPVLVLLLYFAVEGGYYLLAEASIHRAAASFAEVVANESPINPDPDDNTDSDSAVYNGIVASHAADGGQGWLRLVDMMTDNDGDTTGIGIVAQYCIAPEAGDNFSQPFDPLEAGDFGNCPTGPAVECGTELDGTNLAYLRVRVCYEYRPAYPDLPGRFDLPSRWMESHFLALRKDTRL